MLKIRKSFVLLFIAAACCLSITAGAKTYIGTAEQLEWSFNLNNGTLSVTGTGDMPDYLNNFDVPWARFGTLIKRVEIGDGITGVGDNAFMLSTALKSVSLPDSVTHIGYGAFEYCTKLESVNLPEGLTEIDALAFSECSSLTDAVIPSSLESIGAYAFSGCAALEIVDMGSASIDVIPEGAFAGCLSLDGFEMPDGVETIGEGAFYNCASLVSFDVPASVGKISARAFFGAEKLENITFVGTPDVGKDAFYGTQAYFEACFVNYDSSSLYTFKAYPGTAVVYGGDTPVRESSAQYEYTFSGWDKTLGKLYSDEVYTALYTSKTRSYNIVWDIDGNKQTNVFKYGLPTVYTGSEPKKEGYTFVGWNPEFKGVKVTGDAVYTAQFAGEGSEHTVKFYSEDGKKLLGVCTVGNGGSARLLGSKPTKPEDEYASYTFVGWSEDVSAVSGDITVKAVFEANVKAVPGDIFKDGEVNSRDAVKLAQFLAGWDIEFTDSDKAAADVYKDGEVNSRDAVKLAQYLAGWDNIVLG